MCQGSHSRDGQVAMHSEETRKRAILERYPEVGSIYRSKTECLCLVERRGSCFYHLAANIGHGCKVVFQLCRSDRQLFTNCEVLTRTVDVGAVNLSTVVNDEVPSLV